MKILKTIIAVFWFALSIQAQTNNKKIDWDDTNTGKWQKEFVEVQIPSSLDGNMQKAMFYKTSNQNLRPLIVSLHSWSGDYTQEDPIANFIKEYDYNYIHPDFRGPNYNEKACGSKFVIADLEDAIEYAIRNANIDPSEVHIVGSSGGGYATLTAYMNIKYPVKSFSAWVPLSNLESWYWESVGRKQKYAKDILLSTGSNNNILNAEEARKRSPYFQPYSKQLRENAQLYIYAGIHDGYTGSVPITQSIDMYNRLVSEIYPQDKQALVSDADKLELVVKRCYTFSETGKFIGDRKLHYEKQKGNISLSIFEGGHEQIVDQVIPRIPFDKKYELKQKVVLNLGDSNSSFDYSWPQLIDKQSISTDIINYGIPGNTIGFDNLGYKNLNMLSNIDSVFAKIEAENRALDYIIISLGSNDCKAIFANRQNEVKKNIDKLIQKVKSYRSVKKSNTKIIILSIPPADDKKVEEKYYGINERIIVLNKYYKKKASSDKNIIFLDTYSLLQPNIASYTEDGVHINEDAQRLVAKKIKKALK